MAPLKRGDLVFRQLTKAAVTEKSRCIRWHRVEYVPIHVQQVLSELFMPVSTVATV